jgi:MtN3 and saliva related transmembrane protein
MTAGFANVIGYLAASLTTSSFVPQVVRVIRTRDTRAISVLAYIAFCLGIAAWLVYGLALNSLPIVVANAITLVLAGTVLAYKIRLG